MPRKRSTGFTVKEKIDKGLHALAYAALHFGPEGEQAFERMLKIKEEYELRESLLEKARHIIEQDG